MRETNLNSCKVNYHCLPMAPGKSSAVSNQTSPFFFLFYFFFLTCRCSGCDGKGAPSPPGSGIPGQPPPPTAPSRDPLPQACRYPKGLSQLAAFWVKTLSFGQPQPRQVDVLCKQGRDGTVASSPNRTVGCPLGMVASHSCLSHSSLLQICFLGARSCPRLHPLLEESSSGPGRWHADGSTSSCRNEPQLCTFTTA